MKPADWKKDAEARLKDKRVSELTPAEELDSTELWVRNNHIFMAPEQAVMNLLARIDDLRAEVAGVQSLHEGLMKNADKMNDELRAEITALEAMNVDKDELAALRADSKSLLAMCSLLEKCRRDKESLTTQVAAKDAEIAALKGIK